MDRDPHDIGQIVCDAKTLAGKPRLAGTRISVEMVLEELAAGTTAEQLVEMFPFITKEDVQAVIRFALGSLRREEVHLLPESAL